MPEVPEEKKSYLDRARGYLYSGKITIKPKPRVPLHPHDIEVPHGWKEHDNHEHYHMSKLPPPTSFVKKFFLGSIIFFSCALLFAGATFLKGSNTFSNRNIDLVIVAKPFVDGGEKLPVSIEITNRNPVALELADLVFTYTKSSSGDEEPVRIRQSLNTIPSGKTIVRDFPIQLYGEEGSERIIRASLEYRVEGSNAIFEKETEYLVTVRSTPITLTLSVPDATLPNQEIEVKVDIISNAVHPLNDLMLKIVYPTGFEFKNSSPEPSFANNLWLLPALGSAEQTTITLTGIMQGPPGEERVFRAEVGSQSEINEREVGIVYTAMLSPIEVRSSFISIDFSINGNNSSPISAQSETQQGVSINYKNTLQSKIRDVVIVAHLNGEVFDLDSVRADPGFYDRTARTITWDKSTNYNLALLQPGAEGFLNFSFISKPLSSIDMAGNPEVSIAIDVQGFDVLAGDILRIAEKVEEKFVRFNADLRLVQKTLYHSGPIQNIGPIPLRADNETSYTIVWGLTNTINDVGDVEVRTQLPYRVNWKNKVSPYNADLTWNEKTREIIWRAGTIPGDANSSDQLKEVVFQVSLTPIIGQKGRALQLTEDVLVFGRDLFSGIDLKINNGKHTTKLMGDTSSVGADGIVQ